MGFAYNLALAALLPLVLVYLVWRLLILGKSRAGLAQRLGFIPRELRERLAGDEEVVWVHAVSVGEVTAARPIIREFRRLEPLARIVLSTTTPTGRAMAEKGDLDVDAFIYFPFDFPFVVQRVLNALHPQLLVLVETELWPNLLWLARRRGVRTAVVNGKISDRSFERSRFLRPVYAWALSNLDAMCVQSDLDAERFRALGAPAQAVRVAGNAKFDEECPDVSAAQAANLRREMGIADDCPVVVAGSTNPGEDGPVLDAFWHLRVEHVNARLIIAPRHPERADEISDLIHEHGWSFLRRTEILAQGGPPESADDSPVILLDTIGELATVYSVATVVFVGGSLIPKGGHNVLQPLALGKPVLFGPYMHNQKDMASIALREKVAWQVDDAEQLAETITRLVDDPNALRRVAEQGRQVIAKYRGASRRAAARLAALLAHQPAS
ncbi:MAG: 3-deoxy-D-manno-octulosonic acid transferase [Armatimonadota bacterium]